jgi:LysM repeat protein
MRKLLPGWFITLVLVLFALGIGLLLPEFIGSPVPQQQQQPQQQITQIAQQPTATETQLPRTPLPSVTPRATLKPPPTLEPPTATPQPSNTPTITPTATIQLVVTVPGLQGLPTATATGGTPACEERAEWQLRYQVQTNDTLSSIANTFNTTRFDLAEANCLDDPNLIVVGQQLRVPGDALPQTPEFVCTDFELRTPIMEAWGIEPGAQVTFNWVGPETYRNVVRLYPPDYDFANPDPDKWIDRTVDLAQNVTLDMSELRDGGRWQWQVIPVDVNFQQVCPESPLWAFHKESIANLGGAP